MSRLDQGYRIALITKPGKRKDEPKNHLVYSDQLESLANMVYGSLKQFEIYGGHADELHDFGNLERGLLNDEEEQTLEHDCKLLSECYISDVPVLIVDMISRGELPAGRYHVRIRQTEKSHG
jgi:hypothetical protein